MVGLENDARYATMKTQRRKTYLVIIGNRKRESYLTILRAKCLYAVHSFIYSFIHFILYKKVTNATYDKIYKVCSRIDKLEHSLKYM